MSKKELAIVAVIAVVVFIVSIFYVMNKKQNDDNYIKQNESQVIPNVENPISKKKSNGAYEIYNTDITNNTGSTRISASIKNVSGTKREEQTIEIVLLDKNNNELGSLKTTVPALENEGVTTISVESLKVYQNIYDFKIK